MSLSIFGYMKRISILAPMHATLSSVDVPHQIFLRVNDFCRYQGLPPVFEVELVGLTREVPVYGGIYTIHADKTIGEVERTDLIVIPILCGPAPELLTGNEDFIPWIQQQHKRGAEVASLCVGAYLLAPTGLLNGKKCSIHWHAVSEFRHMYPDVHVVGDKIITDEQGIYTGGGGFSYMNLLLYLIEKYTNREMCVLASKMFQIEIDRKSQAPFVIFMGEKEHGDELIKKAQEFIESNYQDKITTEQLTTVLFTDKRNLERRFKKATSNTVGEYIQRVRVEAVKKGLETSSKTIMELMYEVGYSDSKAFRTLFKKITGLTPVAYRSKYVGSGLLRK